MNCSKALAAADRYVSPEWCFLFRQYSSSLHVNKSHSELFHEWYTQLALIKPKWRNGVVWHRYPNWASPGVEKWPKRGPQQGISSKLMPSLGWCPLRKKRNRETTSSAFSARQRYTALALMLKADSTLPCLIGERGRLSCKLWRDRWKYLSQRQVCIIESMI